jgi:GT2 family glycosyltransferase
MRFSIVTTCRNAAHFLPDCLASGVEVEHIITDAASTDGTLDLLKRHSRVQWTSEPDNGMSDGINKGFRRAKGEWVMWLNADDYLLPGALEKVAEFAAAHPEADVIYGDYQFVGPDRALLREKREHRFDGGVLLFFGCYIPSTACFVRRELITAGHLLDESLHVCMDFEFYLRLWRAGARFGYMPEQLAAFRWHGGNASTVLTPRRREERVAVQRAHLAAVGRSWLGSAAMLRVMFWLHRLRRVVLKITGRRAGVSSPAGGPLLRAGPLS